MAGGQAVTRAEKISAREFGEILAKYPALLESLTVGKASKNGQKTMQELDQFRYVDAPVSFGLPKPKRAMNHEDVKTLVEWKLRHGKFRPTLMKLVSSNDPTLVQNTVQQALRVYMDKSDVGATLDVLTKLKGIGPATASLILAVLDPDQVLFFSDEAFYWLCSEGRKDSIKYNTREYADLNSKAKTLVKRLGVKAVDVEKVAYVLMRQDGVVGLPKDSGSANESKSKPAVVPKAPSKKRQGSEEDKHADVSVRRSKRGKSSLNS